MKRLQAHQTSPDAKLLKVAKARHIDFTLARFWVCATEADARQLEIKFKKWKNGRKLCPICHPPKDKT